MNTFAEIVDAIKAYDTIIIHRHQRPDLMLSVVRWACVILLGRIFQLKPS